MSDAAELRDVRDWMIGQRDRLNAEIAAVELRLQALCSHEWRWRQVAGEGRECRRCGLWDLDCDD